MSYWTFAVTFVGGSFATIFIGGYLSDKYDVPYLKAKSLIASISVLGYGISHFFEFYFYVSIYYCLSFVTLNSFLFEGYAPASLS